MGENIKCAAYMPSDEADRAYFVLYQTLESFILHTHAYIYIRLHKHTSLSHRAPPFLSSFPQMLPSVVDGPTRSQSNEPSLISKLSAFVAGLALALTVLATLHNGPIEYTRYQQNNALNIMQGHHSEPKQFNVVPTSISSQSQPHKAIHPRTRHLVSIPIAGQSHSNTIQLSETDDDASGVIASDAIPCSFSFHPNHPSQIAVTIEPSWDNPPLTAMQNALEWLTAVYTSYELGTQYAFSPLYSSEKQEGPIWQRFLGLQAGEFTVDDLNQRLDGESSLVNEIFQYKSSKDLLYLINAKLDSLGVTHSNAPPMLFTVRRVHYLDSRVVCHTKLQQVLRQKYCAARANVPVPFSLYTNSDGKSTSQPIRIAVQLMPSLVEPAGSNAKDPTQLDAFLPSNWPEYIEAISRALIQLVEVLRTHTHAPIHIHLLPSSPLAAGHPLHAIPNSRELRQVVSEDVNKDGSEGMFLHTHFDLSPLHSFHHLVMSDILIAGWNEQALFAVALHEGVTLIPELPHTFKQSHKPVPIYNLPTCSDKTGTYSLRLGSESHNNQLSRFTAFFAPSANDTGASNTKSSGSLRPSRFSFPSQRMVDRRLAEANFVLDKFSRPHSMQVKPDDKLMRLCQAIPEDDNYTFQIDQLQVAKDALTQQQAVKAKL